MTAVGRPRSQSSTSACTLVRCCLQCWVFLSCCLLPTRNLLVLVVLLHTGLLDMLLSPEIQGIFYFILCHIFASVFSLGLVLLCRRRSWERMSSYFVIFCLLYSHYHESDCFILFSLNLLSGFIFNIKIY